jgi:hypothetical protein
VVFVRIVHSSTLARMGGRSFAARRVHNVLVYVHGAAAPSDDEWNSVLALYDESPPAQPLCTLVYTAGAAPNAAQRAQLTAKLGARRVRIAVLTPSPIARAAGTAVHWFRPEVRVFGDNDASDALEHLAVPADVARDVIRVLRELMQEVGIQAR